jgi:hypothetical protein
MLAMTNQMTPDNLAYWITTSFPRLTYTRSGRGMNIAHLNQWF